MNWGAFTRDNRAVAPAVAFILIIGFLILLLAIYQAQIVPQQNAEAELEHHQETRDELRSLHNAISTVGADQEPRFQSINLGTAYEGRTLGINPPPAAGTIRTEQHNISITNESGAGHQENISTQFIEYQPGYNELDIGSTWYENSVLYFDERDRGNSVGIIEDQEMVDNDGNVTVVALQNEFQETGTGRVTLELYPANDLNESSFPEPNGSYSVKIPTRLNGTGYWESQLENSIYENIDPVANEDHDLLNLSVDPDNLDIDKVGIRKEARELRGSEQSNEGAEGPRRVLDGEPTKVEHNDVNDESFPDEKLIIPEGEDFVPESDPDGDDRDDAIEYEFKEYQIDGNLETNESVELTSTDGNINFGSSGTTVSGKQFDFDANGDIIIDGATLKTDAGSTGPGNERMTLNATGNISAINATLDATREIELTANEFVDLTDAEIIVRDADEEGSGGGGQADVEVTANNIVINNTSFVNSDGDEIDRNLEGDVVDSRP